MKKISIKMGNHICGWLLIRDTNKVFDLKFLCILLGTDNMLNQYKASKGYD